MDNWSVSWSCWKCKTCSLRVDLRCKLADRWCAPQIWRKSDNKRLFAGVTRGTGVSSFCSPWYTASLSFLSCALSELFDTVNFRATTYDQFQLHRPKLFSRIDVSFTVRFDCVIYAVFIKWGSRISFLIVGRQDISSRRVSRIGGDGKVRCFNISSTMCLKSRA